jgi:hypothetical protein
MIHILFDERLNKSRLIGLYLLKHTTRSHYLLRNVCTRIEYVTQPIAPHIC